jgi:hypothetical protein
MPRILFLAVSLLSFFRRKRDDFFSVSAGGINHLFTDKKSAVDFAASLDSGVKIKRISL